MSLGKLFYSQQKNYQNIGRKTKMNLCWKYLDPSLNNCEVLTQWDFVILYPTLTYIHSNLNTLSNFLEDNQCIDGNMWNKKPSSSPQPSTSLWGKQIHISNLDMAHYKFSTTPKEKFQDQFILVHWIWYTQVKYNHIKYWTKKLKDTLYQKN